MVMDILGLGTIDPKDRGTDGELLYGCEEARHTYGFPTGCELMRCQHANLFLALSFCTILLIAAIITEIPCQQINDYIRAKFQSPCPPSRIDQAMGALDVLPQQYRSPVKA